MRNAILCLFVLAILTCVWWAGRVEVRDEALLPDGGAASSAGVPHGLDSEELGRVTEDHGALVDGVNADRWRLLVRLTWRATGLAARGQFVEIVNAEDPFAHSTRARWRLRSNESGEVSIDRLATDARLWVRPPGEDWTPVTRENTAAVVVLELALHDDDSRIVRVLSPDRVPVPGARVLAGWGWGSRNSRPEDTFEVGVTDAAGELRISRASEAGSVIAVAEGYAQSKPSWLFDVQEKQRIVELILGVSTGALDVTVETDEELPVANAHVALSYGQREKDGAWPVRNDWGATNVQGRVRIDDLPAGRAVMVVDHEVAGSWVGELELLPGNDQQHRVRLQSHGRVTGRVTFDDEAVEGASVSVHDKLTKLHRARTSLDGEFTIDGVAIGPVELFAHHPELGTAEHRGHVSAAAPLRREARLERGGVLEGVVLDHLRRPVSGWQVLASPPPLSQASGVRRNLQAFTSEHGRWRLTGCGPLPYVIEVRPPPFTQRLPFAQLTGVRPDQPDLQIIASAEGLGGRVRGRLVGSDDLGSLFLQTERSDNVGRMMWELDIASGHFDVGPLVGGDYALFVSIADRAHPLVERVYVVDGEVVELGELPVPIPGSLRVRITSPTDTPLATLELEIVERMSPKTVVDLSSHVGDEIVLNDLPGGTYTVTVGGGSWWAHARVEIEDGEEQVIDVNLEPCSPLELRLKFGPAVSEPVHLALVSEERGIVRSGWIPYTRNILVRWAAPAGTPVLRARTAGGLEFTREFVLPLPSPDEAAFLEWTIGE